MDKVAKRIERLQQASERWRSPRFKDASASDEEDALSDSDEGALEDTESMQSTARERSTKAAAEDLTHDTVTYYDRSNG